MAARLAIEVAALRQELQREVGWGWEMECRVDELEHELEEARAQ